MSMLASPHLFQQPSSPRWATWQNCLRNPKEGHMQCVCVGHQCSILVIYPSHPWPHGGRGTMVSTIIDCCDYPPCEGIAPPQQSIWHGGGLSNRSNPNDDAHSHLIGCHHQFSTLETWEHIPKLSSMHLEYSGLIKRLIMIYPYFNVIVLSGYAMARHCMWRRQDLGAATTMVGWSMIS